MKVHRAHDYLHLVRRWRAVARNSGLAFQRFARDGDYDLIQLQSPALRAEGGIYISAGIHGDEAGATEGLIGWAEVNVSRLAELPLLLFPCLNPWGLVRNRRGDAGDVDLNRAFHRDDLPVVTAVKRSVAAFRFEVALFLHEDFDGQGLYLYEIKRRPPQWGEALLKAASRVIPIDPRGKIDGRKALTGLIRRRFQPQVFAAMGYPEAIWFHCHHSSRSLTIETPSEFSLEQRALAHAAVIDEVLRLGGWILESRRRGG